MRDADRRPRPAAAELQADRRAEPRAAPHRVRAARAPRARAREGAARRGRDARRRPRTHGSSTPSTSRARSTSRWCAPPSARAPPGSSIPRRDVARHGRHRRRSAPPGAAPRGGRLPPDPRPPRGRRRPRGATRGTRPDRSRRWTSAGLAERLRAGDVDLLDVRDDDEWEEGHVEGSTPRPVPRPGGRPSRRDRGRTASPLAVACSVGNRSSIAASLLARAGVDDVIHVADGGVPDLAGRGDSARPGLSRIRC